MIEDKLSSVPGELILCRALGAWLLLSYLNKTGHTQAGSVIEILIPDPEIHFPAFTSITPITGTNKVQTNKPAENLQAYNKKFYLLYL